MMHRYRRFNDSTMYSCLDMNLDVNLNVDSDADADVDVDADAGGTPIVPPNFVEAN